tara:strand:+ start:424 stop:777 length:354 start_codon:yes stop_codon:yes gene_type:complete
MKYILYLFISLLFLSCKSDAELAMERGIQYYEWDMIEKSILEFKYVIHQLSKEPRNLDYQKIKVKSRAHHNLAVAYAKKTWYDDAIKEAKNAFNLIPSEENKKVVDLIQKKVSNKSK